MADFSLEELNNLYILYIVFETKQFNLITSGKTEICTIPLLDNKPFKIGDFIIISEYDEQNQGYTNLHTIIQIKTILTQNDFDGIDKNFIVIYFEVIKSVFNADIFGSLRFKQ